MLLLLVGLTFRDLEDELVFALSGLEVLWVNLFTSSPLAIGSRSRHPSLCPVLGSKRIAVLLRTNGLSAPDCIADHVAWEEWIGIEDRRRTLFVGFTLLSLPSLALNVARPLMNREVMLSLPHPTAQRQNSSGLENKHSESTARAQRGDL